MKKVTLFFIFIIVAASMASAQVTSLNENFDAACGASTPAYPAGWVEYNPTYASPVLNWNCTPEGRNGTPGMQCSGTFNGNKYKDTAWFFTPELDLSSYPGNVYFQFDAKYDFVAGKISVLKTTNPNPLDSINFASQDLTDSANPNVFISPIDSDIWITYQINVTDFKSDNLYMAFRYTSTTDSAGVWTIDNVLTTGTPLSVSNVKAEQMPLIVVGNSTSNQIKLSFAVPQAGQYTIAAYDMMGRQLYHDDFYANSGTQTYSITNLHLSSGMYFVKMGNGTNFGAVKTVVQ